MRKCAKTTREEGMILVSTIMNGVDKENFFCSSQDLKCRDIPKEFISSRVTLLINVG